MNTSQLEPATTSRLEEIATDIHMRMKRTVEDIIQIGKGLTEAKDALGYSGFGKWCDRQFPEMSRETRSKFMQVAERFGNVRISDNLAPSVYQILAPKSVPDDVVKAVLERADRGEKIDVAAAKEAVREAKGISKEDPRPTESHPLSQLHDLVRQLMKNGMKMDDIEHSVRSCEAKNFFIEAHEAHLRATAAKAPKPKRLTKAGVKVNSKQLSTIEDQILELVVKLGEGKDDYAIRERIDLLIEARIVSKPESFVLDVTFKDQHWATLSELLTKYDKAGGKISAFRETCSSALYGELPAWRGYQLS